METSNAEISEALLQKMIPLIDHETTDEAPRQTSTPLKTTGNICCSQPYLIIIPCSIDQKDKALTHPKSDIGVSRNGLTFILNFGKIIYVTLVMGCSTL